MNDAKGSRRAIPELFIEQWRLGELSEESRIALIQEFGFECIEKEVAKLNALEADYWAGRKPQPKTRRNIRWYYASAPFLIAASAFFFVQQGRVSNPEPSHADNIMLKGNGQVLKVFKQTTSGPMLLKDGDTLKAGDIIQLSYEAGLFMYGVIVSMDGRGTVTWHFPVQRNGDQRLEKGRAIALKEAYKLDDAPGFERFFFIRSNEEIDVEAVAAALKEAGPDVVLMLKNLKLDSRFDQSSFLLRK